MRTTKTFILTILIIIALAFTSTATAAETEPATLPLSLFNDVSLSGPQVLYINYLAHKEIMKGYPDGGFHPRDSLTRAQPF